MSKRYLLFAYNEYYPNGGMYDCKLGTNNWDEVEERLTFLKDKYEFFQYYDTEVDDSFDWDGDKGEWVMKDERYNI